MPLTVHIEELTRLVGRHLGYSDWHEITQRQVDLFAEATWDRQWIHVDPARAAAGPYGGTIAHGFLTIALTPALLAEIWQVEGVDMTVNQLVTNLKFRAAVPVGARLRMGAQLVAARQRPRDFTEVTVRLTFESDTGDGAHRVAGADHVFLLRAAAPGADPATELFAQLRPGSDPSDAV